MSIFLVLTLLMPYHLPSYHQSLAQENNPRYTVQTAHTIVGIQDGESIAQADSSQRIPTIQAIVFSMIFLTLLLLLRLFLISPPSISPHTRSSHYGTHHKYSGASCFSCKTEYRTAAFWLHPLRHTQSTYSSSCQQGRTQ